MQGRLQPHIMVFLLLPSLHTNKLLNNTVFNALEDEKTVTWAANNIAAALFTAVQNLIFVNTAIIK